MLKINGDSAGSSIEIVVSDKGVTILEYAIEWFYSDRYGPDNEPHLLSEIDVDKGTARCIMRQLNKLAKQRNAHCVFCCDYSYNDIALAADIAGIEVKEYRHA